MAIISILSSLFFVLLVGSFFTRFFSYDRANAFLVLSSVVVGVSMTILIVLHDFYGTLSSPESTFHAISNKRPLICEIGDGNKLKLSPLEYVADHDRGEIYAPKNSGKEFRIEYANCREWLLSFVHRFPNPIFSLVDSANQ